MGLQYLESLWPLVTFSLCLGSQPRAIGILNTVDPLASVSNYHVIMLHLPRGGSRNVEGGVLILCRAVGSNFVLGLVLQKAVHRGT